MIPRTVAFSAAGLIAIAFLAVTTATIGARPDSVTLKFFAATPFDDAVLVEWATATEIDTSGFYVGRGLTAAGTYSHVSDFIPAVGDPLIGGTYDYVDGYLPPGQSPLYYRLEVVNNDQTIDIYGPISVTWLLQRAFVPLLRK